MSFQYKVGFCPVCGKKAKLAYSNNILAQPICFDCIKQHLHYDSTHDANIFCRTYNIPFDPSLWIKMATAIKGDVFEQYMAAQLETHNEFKSGNDDIWETADSEWSKMIRFSDLLSRIAPLKDSYTQRQRLVWGEEYTFEELIELDSLYIRSIQANNIVNPLQKKSLKTLLKVMADMDNAITQKDSAELKNLASTYKTLAATAQLGEMIEQTKTDDITTLAEVAETLEANNFEMPYYHGEEKDAIDKAIQDIQEVNRYTILNATGLTELVQSISEKRQQAKESDKTQEAIKETSLEDLKGVYLSTPDDIPEEDDTEITKQDFSEDGSDKR